ncbi:hypothetical protein ABEB36_012390 [Hypothenemus hampei]
MSNSTIWEYKECDSPYKNFACSNPEILNIKSNITWKRHSNKQRLEIDSLKKKHGGMYRCVEKGVVKKLFIIEVVGLNGYESPPPLVQSLLISNMTNQLNMEFTIQCNVTSSIPPTVIWFKKCYGSKCDIECDNICYCHLNVPTSSYSIGNIYINKMNIYNARDIDSGLYACLAVTEYGKDYKYVTINVPDTGVKGTGSGSFSLLFLIPLVLMVIPLLVWLCYVRRKKKSKVVVVANGQQQQALIKPSSTCRPTRTMV